MTQPPEYWLQLPDLQRDILIILDVDGPSSGNQLLDKIGGYHRRSSKATMSRNISELRDSGFVESHPKRGRDSMTEITGDGRQVVEAAREWMQA